MNISAKLYYLPYTWIEAEAAATVSLVPSVSDVAVHLYSPASFKRTSAIQYYFEKNKIFICYSFNKKLFFICEQSYNTICFMLELEVTHI